MVFSMFVFQKNLFMSAYRDSLIFFPPTCILVKELAVLQFNFTSKRTASDTVSDQLYQRCFRTYSLMAYTYIMCVQIKLVI